MVMMAKFVVVFLVLSIDTNRYVRLVAPRSIQQSTMTSTTIIIGNDLFDSCISVALTTVQQTIQYEFNDRPPQVSRF